MCLYYCMKHCIIQFFAAANEGDSHSTSKIGYVLALHYSDQITGATANVLSLQCWVGHYLSDEVKVVEPFIIIGSVFGVSFSPSMEENPSETNSVTLYDLFDKKSWKNYCESNHYAQLEQWNNFIQHVPRKMILVQHTWLGFDPCSKDAMRNLTKEYVAKYNFEIVKEICIMFDKIGAVTSEEFKKLLYDGYNPSEVVLVFNRWGGIVDFVGDYRLTVKNTHCTRDRDNKRLMPLNNNIIKDSKLYKQRYLKGSSHYLAVMFRIERFASDNKLHTMSKNQQKQALTRCVGTIIDAVERVKKEHNLSQVFLAMDYGKYGSYFFRPVKGVDPNERLDSDLLNPIVISFVEKLFGESLSLKQWEESFDSIVHHQTPGYVALVQKTIAANATCLLLAGGGTFQVTAENMYRELHNTQPCFIPLCRQLL